MTTVESVVLIRRAKEGDREAWSALCDKYYPRWLARFHDQLGEDMRSSYDTSDLVQSAVADALRDIRDLRCEAAFYSWVTAIIYRKIALLRRNQRLKCVPLEGDIDRAAGAEHAFPAASNDEDYLRLLDAIIALFPEYPENMAAVYLHYFSKIDRSSQAQALGQSVRTVHRLTETGVVLLRSQLA